MAPTPDEAFEKEGREKGSILQSCINFGDQVREADKSRTEGATLSGQKKELKERMRHA